MLEIISFGKVFFCRFGGILNNSLFNKFLKRIIYHIKHSLTYITKRVKYPAIYIYFYYSYSTPYGFLCLKMKMFNVVSHKNINYHETGGKLTYLLYDCVLRIKTKQITKKSMHIDRKYTKTLDQSEFLSTILHLGTISSIKNITK